MKTILFMVGMIGISSVALAAEPVITPVREVRITRATGCGNVPLPGHGIPGYCRDEISASFVVPSGGPCHHYEAVVTHDGNGSVVTFLDQVAALCMAPEKRNYHVSVNLPEASFSTNSGPIQIFNPTFVETIRRM